MVCFLNLVLRSSRLRTTRRTPCNGGNSKRDVIRIIFQMSVKERLPAIQQRNQGMTQGYLSVDLKPIGLLVDARHGRVVADEEEVVPCQEVAGEDLCGRLLPYRYRVIVSQIRSGPVV